MAWIESAVGREADHSPPSRAQVNPLHAKLNPICRLLALLGAHHILHVSRIRVNNVWVIPPLPLCACMACLGTILHLFINFMSRPWRKGINIAPKWGNPNAVTQHRVPEERRPQQNVGWLLAVAVVLLRKAGSETYAERRKWDWCICGDSVLAGPLLCCG